jgi:hypothetical protein
MRRPGRRALSVISLAFLRKLTATALPLRRAASRARARTSRNCHMGRCAGVVLDYSRAAARAVLYHADARGDHWPRNKYPRFRTRPRSPTGNPSPDDACGRKSLFMRVVAEGFLTLPQQIRNRLRGRSCLRGPGCHEADETRCDEAVRNHAAMMHPRPPDYPVVVAPIDLHR